MTKTTEPAQVAGIEPVALRVAKEEAYDKIDRFLRNNMSDRSYAEYSAALDLVYLASPADQLRAAQVKEEWQPIETAPKDGTSILAVIRGFQPAIAYWDNGKSKWLTTDEDDHTEEACFESSMLGLYYPTHWMPLPAAPQPSVK